MKIVVAEDKPAVRKIMVAILNHLGFNDVLEAGDGEQALALARFNPVGLIISDLEMPRMTGLEFLIAVRKDIGLKKTPFLMVTNVNRQDAILKAVAAGVNGYILKPFSVEAVEAKLRKLGIACTMAPGPAPPQSPDNGAGAADLGAWLDALDCGQYRDAFASNDISAAMLKTLTDEDLKTMGVMSLGHRKKILAAIPAFAS